MRFFLGLCLALALCACATAPDRGHPSSSLQAKTEQDWSGRLALTVTSADPSQNRTFSANFEISGSAREGSWVLWGPLGNALARLDWSPRGASLLSNEHGPQPQQFDSIDSLLAHTHVAGLPFVTLFDWLQGIPTPATGWEVDLSQFNQGKLRAQRLASDPSIDLRLVLDR